MAEEVLGVFPCLVRKQTTSLYVTTGRIIFHVPGTTAEESQVIPLSYVTGFVMNKPRPELPPEQQKALIKLQFREADSPELRERVIDFTGDGKFTNCGICERLLRDHAGDRAEERRLKQKDEQDRIVAARLRFLEANPEVRLRYQFLTAEGGLSPEEFWDQYGEEIKAGITDEPEAVAVPVPLRRPDMLQADLSANVVTVTDRRELVVTPERAAEIFKQFPRAKELFDQLVPASISEKNFWKRFYHSQYFNLSQGITVPAGKDSVFDSLLVESQAPLDIKPGCAPVDPDIDLTADYLVPESNVFSFREGGEDSASRLEVGGKVSSNQAAAHSTLINRFNRANSLVGLETTDDSASLRSRREKSEQDMDKDIIKLELNELTADTAIVTKAEIERLRRVRPKRSCRKYPVWPSERVSSSPIVPGLEGVARATIQLTGELVGHQADRPDTSRKARRLEATNESEEINAYLDRGIELLKFLYSTKVQESDKRQKILDTLNKVKEEVNLRVAKMRLGAEWVSSVNVLNSMLISAEVVCANIRI